MAYATSITRENLPSNIKAQSLLSINNCVTPQHTATSLRYGTPLSLSGACQEDVAASTSVRHAVLSQGTPLTVSKL